MVGTVHSGKVGRAVPEHGSVLALKNLSGDVELPVLTADGKIPVDAAVTLGDITIDSADPTAAGTSTTASVSASESSVTLIAANAARLPKSRIYNDADKTLIYFYGTTASATALSGKILPQGEHILDSTYTGKVAGIWASGVDTSKKAFITELSA